MHICYANGEVKDMAEFCIDCWNNLNGKKGSPLKYVLSKEVELCEGCGNIAWAT